MIESIAMAIEKVDYSHLIGRGELKNGEGEFRMEVTYPYVPSTFLTEEEFLADRARLERRSSGLWTFVIGAYTSLLDPKTGLLPWDYTLFIRGIHNFYTTKGLGNYSCFLRERFGAVGISSEYATILDKMALEKSDFLTVLPGASNSNGTWKEITYGTQKGTELICLFRESDPDMAFRQRIMEAAAVHGVKSELTFVTFRTQSDLMPQLEVVVPELMGRRITQ